MPHPKRCTSDTHDGVCLKKYVQAFMESHEEFQELRGEERKSVHLTYTVGTKGCISNVLIRREELKGSGKVISNILSSMPRWKPGETLGAPVRVRQHVTIEIPSVVSSLGQE